MLIPSMLLISTKSKSTTKWKQGDLILICKVDDFFPKHVLQNDEWYFKYVLPMALTGGKALIPLDPHYSDFTLLELICKGIRWKYMRISDT